MENKGKTIQRKRVVTKRKRAEIKTKIIKNLNKLTSFLKLRINVPIHVFWNKSN
jgi:hypothetical protein